MDIRAIRRVWRGIQFDSQLEADWAATFEAWGMEYHYHPGFMVFDDGVRWEPDFLLENDVVFEVKGEHNERLDKAKRAGLEFGLSVVIGRGGIIHPGMTVEAAGAVWEPSRWAVRHDDEARRSVFVDTDGLSDVSDLMWSADVALLTGAEGIRCFKAVGDDEIV